MVIYINNTIISLIQANYPEFVPEMDKMLLGSVGLGIDDEISDRRPDIWRIQYGKLW